jgi:radical SAM superfamily enzyme YgiQ (UPF0313 family)
MSDVVVVSTFEGGYQPNTAISAASALRAGGADVDLLDVYVEGPAMERVAGASMVAVSVPLFDSLSAATQIASQIRVANADAPIVFFGQYATINAQRLAAKYCDYAISGEWEKPIVALSRQVLDRRPAELIDGVVSRDPSKSYASPHPFFSKGHVGRPDRGFVPSLRKYPQPHLSRLLRYEVVAGGVEATRGCHHRCSYCSVFAAYDGKVVMVDENILVDDVRALVADGMTHLTFTDADFFNAKHHGLRILRRLHAEFPHVTYDMTTRVDHVLEHIELVREAATLGLRIITSALEFPSDEVLRQLDKEVTVEMTERCITELKAMGVMLNPTFIMFNPWIGLPDLVRFEDFLERTGLTDLVDPIQFETRLHLYKGSPLLQNPSVQKLKLTEQEFHFDWEHDDPAMDEVFLSSLTPVEEGTFKRCCLKC